MRGHPLRAGPPVEGLLRADVPRADDEVPLGRIDLRCANSRTAGTILSEASQVHPRHDVIAGAGLRLHALVCVHRILKLLKSVYGPGRRQLLSCWRNWFLGTCRAGTRVPARGACGVRAHEGSSGPPRRVDAAAMAACARRGSGVYAFLLGDGESRRWGRPGFRGLGSGVGGGLGAGAKFTGHRAVVPAVG